MKESTRLIIVITFTILWLVVNVICSYYYFAIQHIRIDNMWIVFITNFTSLMLGSFLTWLFEKLK